MVEIDVTNPEAFVKEYAPIAGKALTENGGKYLARGGKNVSIEGEPPRSRAVILAFENLEKAQAAFASPAYKEGRTIGDKYAKLGFGRWKRSPIDQRCRTECPLRERTFLKSCAIGSQAVLIHKITSDAARAGLTARQ